MTQDQLDLLHGYLNGTLDEADFARLQSLLRESAEARRTLRGLSTVESKLTQLAAIHPETVRLLSAAAKENGSCIRRLAWRPLTAAAAGIVIGLFSASVVWAYVVPRGARVPLRVPNASFENIGALTRAVASERADEWFGADVKIVKGGEGLPGPKSGRHMLRLGPMKGAVPSQASLMLRLDENRPAGVDGLQLDISAWFHASTVGRREQYTLRAATFWEEPAAVAAMVAAGGVTQAEWRSLQDEAGSMAGLGVICEADETGWQRVRIRLEVPPQARTLLIRLLANTPGPPQDRTAHFIDDVHASWIVPPAAPSPLP